MKKKKLQQYDSQELSKKQMNKLNGGVKVMPDPDGDPDYDKFHRDPSINP